MKGVVRDSVPNRRSKRGIEGEWGFKDWHLAIVSCGFLFRNPEWRTYCWTMQRRGISVFDKGSHVCSHESLRLWDEVWEKVNSFWNVDELKLLFYSKNDGTFESTLRKESTSCRQVIQLEVLYSIFPSVLDSFVIGIPGLLPVSCLKGSKRVTVRFMFASLTKNNNKFYILLWCVKTLPG